LAHAEPSDMLPDTLGRGVREDDGIDPSRADTLAAIQKVASTGFMRSSKLLVFSGGADRTSGSASTTSTATDTQGQVVVDGTATVSSVAVQAAVVEEVEVRLDQIRMAKAKGYEGDACGECGNFTLVRNGTCMKCVTCGATSGCS
ncbi:MAG: hypothetical protein VW835_06265, partial [Rickettsiales bacterium]